MEGTDDFAEYGKPLEPLDEDAIPRKKAFSLEDQVVRDEKGRRRFHGAFTGGFSAGYWNTVGSFEGWQPSEFKSSRAERASAVQKTPQDFMDREDMSEFGIAPNRVIARDEYSAEARKRSIPEFNDSGPIPGRPALQDLLKPVRETVGVRLLKQMGWRPGQGVGPRVSAVEKRRIYGCSLPPGPEASEDGDSDDEFIPEDLTFAPDDVQAYVVTPKKDNFGLGYSGLDRRSVFGVKKVSTGLKMTTSDNRKVDIRGQAFGVGAFEEEDEDVYSREDISNYDFELTDEAASASKKTHTMPGVLEGFVRALNKVVKKIYPPPALPKTYKPVHKMNKSRWDMVETKTPQGLPVRPKHNAESRATALGELSKRNVAPSEADLKKREETLKMISGTKSISSSFKPFTLNPDKQKRYEQYQQLVAIGASERFADLQPVSMSLWERNQELKEFEQANKIFRPLTGVMDDRFTQGAQTDNLVDPLAVVEKHKYGTEDQRNAAKMKMFGQLTRITSEWTPCSLLCKRFNVPELNTIPESMQKKREKKKYSIFDNLDSLMEKPDWELNERSSITQEAPKEFETHFESNYEVEDIPMPVGPEKPPEVDKNLIADPASKIDLFKAIFLDSSDDDEEQEDNSKREQEPISVPDAQMPYEEEIRNNLRNSSPPRGLFENIDFEALSRPAKNSCPVTEKREAPDVKQDAPQQLSDLSNSDNSFYGPKIPDNLSYHSVQPVVSEDRDDEVWEEKKDHKSKKKKKDKKNKHKHKSSKKNKK